MHELMGTPEPIRPEYRDRDARLATMDAQGLAKVWLFPTLGMLYEEALKHDPGAVVLCSAPSTAGWPRTGAWRTGTASSPPPTSRWPTSTRRSRELEWALDQDARTVVHAGRRADHGRAGRSRRRPTMFDPFWARVNEAGITVVVHAGDAGLSSNGYAVDGFSASFKGGGSAPAEHQDVRH